MASRKGATHAPASERLERHYTPEPNSGCWLWTGSTRGAGYADFRVGGKNRLAHRVSYEATFGPIPDGLTLDHKCRVRCCVNPHHLEPVTQRVNTLRGISPSAKNAAKIQCDQGHDLAFAYITPAGGRTCRVCQAATARAYRARLKERINPWLVTL